MTTPRQTAKGLGIAQKSHIKHGIAGASRALLDALERRGIVHESERKPGYLVLTPVGECVRVMLFGYDPESMTDDERVEFSNLYGQAGKGPAEWENCDKHPEHGQVFRWTWDTSPEDDGDADAMQSCSKCSEELDAADD